MTTIDRLALRADSSGPEGADTPAVTDEPVIRDQDARLHHWSPPTTLRHRAA